uniref:Uncharacterized protein n=1 Tax=Dikerogammarus haemobaphes virus 1 TaxID=2704946 RepID=A0A6G9HDK1_9VIRU|nr:hypothetical protein [Dikerogammarus haemobaphes virus 1]
MSVRGSPGSSGNSPSVRGSPGSSGNSPSVRGSPGSSDNSPSVRGSPGSSDNSPSVRGSPGSSGNSPSVRGSPGSSDNSPKSRNDNDKEIDAIIDEIAEEFYARFYNFQNDDSSITELPDSVHETIKASIRNNDAASAICHVNPYDEASHNFYTSILFYFCCMKYYAIYNKIDMESVLRLYEGIPSYFADPNDSSKNYNDELNLYYKLFILYHDLETSQYDKALQFFYQTKKTVNIEVLAEIINSRDTDVDRVNIRRGTVISLNIPKNGESIDANGVFLAYLTEIYPLLTKPFRGYVTVTTTLPPDSDVGVTITKNNISSKPLQLLQGLVDIQEYYINFEPTSDYTEIENESGASVFHIPKRIYIKPSRQMSLNVIYGFQITHLPDKSKRV